VLWWGLVRELLRVVICFLTPIMQGSGEQTYEALLYYAQVYTSISYTLLVGDILQAKKTTVIDVVAVGKSSVSQWWVDGWHSCSSMYMCISDNFKNW
jgi:hypothetical protein